MFCMPPRCSGVAGGAQKKSDIDVPTVFGTAVAKVFGKSPPAVFAPRVHRYIDPFV